MSGNEWQTPPDLFAQVNEWVGGADADFRGGFTVDLASSGPTRDGGNGVPGCAVYYTPFGVFDADGTNLYRIPKVFEYGSTYHLERERVWCNPPYGRTDDGRTLRDWARFLVTLAGYPPEDDKEAAEWGIGRANLVVALVPDARDTEWWRIMEPYATVHPLGRVRFINPETGQPGAAPPGGHALFVFRPRWLRRGA